MNKCKLRGKYGQCHDCVYNHDVDMPEFYPAIGNDYNTSKFAVCFSYKSKYSVTYINNKTETE